MFFSFILIRDKCNNLESMDLFNLSHHSFIYFFTACTILVRMTIVKEKKKREL